VDAGIRRVEGVGDFLLGSLPPVDLQTIELVAESVAPALKAAVAT